jgi:hypothetical protein
MWLERPVPGRCPCGRGRWHLGDGFLRFTHSFTFASDLGELALVLFLGNQQSRQNGVVLHRRQADVDALSLHEIVCPRYDPRRSSGFSGCN